MPFWRNTMRAAVVKFRILNFEGICSMNSLPSTLSRPARPLLGAVLFGVTFVGMSQAATAADLSGCWEGCWKSCTDRFEGTVKARITRCSDTCYEAVFTGWAFKIMPYKYKAVLTVVGEDEEGRLHFKSSRKLPFWGCYWVDGHVTDCDFFATYRTDDHTGYFKMRRTCCRKKLR